MMKYKIIFASAIFFTAIAQAQVGIDNTMPSSTLDVNGSIEGIIH